MSDLTTWLRDHFEQAGHPTDGIDAHVRVARTLGFGPTETAYLARITGASTDEIQERARTEREQRTSEGHHDLEATLEYRLLKACFPDAEP